MKKNVGIVLIVIGGLMLLSGLNLAVTKYDFSSSHDLSKFFGAAAVSTAVLATGILLIKRANEKNQ
jgi:hypothetical protein